MNYLKNIKALMSQMDTEAKRQLKEAVSEEFGLTIGTVKNHWMNNLAIPEKHQPRFIELAQGVIRERIKQMQGAIDFE